ncbi:MAG: hypothetical protein Sylvanvirus35_5 [Sylvanvirus sp.]|uniref:Uncharacterized protein n=1 Tax=Sylvanvirus sp. TaxID=2487774 RepID=A0A3G5AJ41_9VIRU|nr:MAG: hypothetical protein Sylvanvirus35_5 [Sylvanvirus sp.]
MSSVDHQEGFPEEAKSPVSFFGPRRGSTRGRRCFTPEEDFAIFQQAVEMPMTTSLFWDELAQSHSRIWGPRPGSSLKKRYQDYVREIQNPGSRRLKGRRRCAFFDIVKNIEKKLKIFHEGRAAENLNL